MNEIYIGKYCPFCKTPFSETDDIVVCSQCDMPHHKDCWVENGGCTTFGCLGTIKSVDPTAQTSVTSNSLDFEMPAQPQRHVNASIKYCTRCGAKNSVSSRFCEKCGNAMGLVEGQNSYSNQQIYSANMNQPSQQYNNNHQYNQQQYSQYGQQYHNPYGFVPRDTMIGADAERMQLVGQNQAYYAKKFTSMSTQNKKATWNWCAFLFSPYWFIYRKMYGYGFGVLAAYFVLSLIPGTFISLLSLGGSITLGILGNYIYMKNIDNLMTQMRTIPYMAKYQFVAEKGGVNKAATTWVVIGYYVLNMIITLARM